MKNVATKKSHSHVILKIWNMYIPRGPVITKAITVCKNGFHYYRPNIFLKLLCMALRFRAYHARCLLF